MVRQESLRLSAPVPQAKPRRRPEEPQTTPSGAPTLPNLEEASGELGHLVGLDGQKALFEEIYALAKVEHQRRRVGLKAERQSLHMVFHGNPGTGKTTVARLLGLAFRRIGLLTKGHFVEVGRADLVGEYIGHTAQRTRHLLRQAEGGVLFIDEAYALGRGGERDFGREAIDTIVKGIEEAEGDLVVILAGYGREMERFFDLNPGLASRIPLKIAFPDYTAKELLQIADTMLKDRDYKLSPDARFFLERALGERASRWDPNRGNARHIRNIMEKAIRRQAVRLIPKAEATREDLQIILWADIQDSGLL